MARSYLRHSVRDSDSAAAPCRPKSDCQVVEFSKLPGGSAGAEADLAGGDLRGAGASRSLRFLPGGAAASPLAGPERIFPLRTGMHVVCLSQLHDQDRCREKPPG
jgi:hypothetical protein